MLYQLTAAVEASALVGEPLQIDNPPIWVGLEIAPDQQRIVKIRATKKVALADARLPEFKTTGAHSHAIVFPFDDPHFQDLLSLLQYIESIGSLYLGVRRIMWEEAKYEFVGEDADEVRQLQVYSVESKRTYRQTRLPANQELLRRMLASRQKLADLVVPMAFYREGMNEVRAHRYVNAFHNFYFILEGMFGRGKSNNKQVEKAFGADPTMTKAVEGAIQTLNSPDPAQARHLRALEVAFQRSKDSFDVKGVISFIVWMRGTLSHFTPNASTPKGHPLNQRDFESTSHLLLLIVTRVLGERANLVR